MKKFSFSLLIILFFSSFSYSQTETELYKKLKSIKEITSITTVKVDTSFTEGYELLISQPVDHNKPNGVKFNQRVFLSHKNYTSPVVFVTEGYSAGGNAAQEPTKLFNANQIVVEHRYFGKSIPQKKDWKYLTVKQAADDHHFINQIFKKIYSGKWISTGISKGGETTLFYKRFYPNDVDASIPYVAPVNLAAEDPRIYMFLNSVGTEECRNKILQFQRAFLKNREEIKKLIAADAEKNKLEFFCDYDFLIEYITLEYPFAFWQWGIATCEEIPSENSSAEVLYAHMKKANPPYFFTKKAMEEFGAFYVQAYNEIGYYGYDISPLKDLLTEFTTSSNSILVPKDAKIKFDATVMNDINNWLVSSGNNILYIYGGNDTWNATSIQLTGLTNSLKMVKKGGSHRTRISSFDKTEKELIFTTLEKWLNLKINRK